MCLWNFGLIILTTIGSKILDVNRGKCVSLLNTSNRPANNPRRTPQAFATTLAQGTNPAPPVPVPAADLPPAFTEVLDILPAYRAVVLDRTDGS